EHRAFQCGSEAPASMPYEAPPASVSTSYVAIRVEGAATGATVGVDVGGRPLLWVRGYDPAYVPTYRFRSESAYGTIHTSGNAAGPSCRVIIDTLSALR